MDDDRVCRLVVYIRLSGSRFSWEDQNDILKQIPDRRRWTDEAGVDLRLGAPALAWDPASRTVTDDKGNVYRYDKLLLETGGAPRRLPFADDGVICFRDMDDYHRVRALADRHARLVVIGGGCIGSEMAAALTMNGCEVSMIFPVAGIGAQMYPPALCDFLNGYFRQEGVTVLPGETVKAIGKSDHGMTVRISGAKDIECGDVIAGIGIEPQVDLARSIGLAVDNGIVVDEQLRTTHVDVYAAGDVANFYSSALGVRRGVEHEDNANTMGMIAGRNTAGASEKYDHLPYFYSDLFNLGYEAVGELDSRMDMVEDWTEPNRKGVVYYLREEYVRGVLLWNTWARSMPRAS